LIEHLSDWQVLLNEARRLLAPDGQFLVSTPNKDYYTDSRAASGPNPYHAHEFTFPEFEAALRAIFPSVSLFTQNHAGALVFQPLHPSGATDLRVDQSAPNAGTANFYLAVCALGPQSDSPSFVYVPTASNVLREREQHIAKLEWSLENEQKMHAAAIEESNRWAQQLNADLAAARESIAAFQSDAAALRAELIANQSAAQAALDQTQARHVEAILAANQEINRVNAELEQSQQTVEERTQWALRLQAHIDAYEARWARVRSSRWYRIGRRLGLRLGLAAGEENSPTSL
jgi:hypothetical protein